MKYAPAPPPPAAPPPFFPDRPPVVALCRSAAAPSTGSPRGAPVTAVSRARAHAATNGQWRRGGGHARREDTGEGAGAPVTTAPIGGDGNTCIRARPYPPSLLGGGASIGRRRPHAPGRDARARTRGGGHGRAGPFRPGRSGDAVPPGTLERVSSRRLRRVGRARVWVAGSGHGWGESGCVCVCGGGEGGSRPGCWRGRTWGRPSRSCTPSGGRPLRSPTRRGPSLPRAHPG